MRCDVKHHLRVAHRRNCVLQVEYVKPEQPEKTFREKSETVLTHAACANYVMKLRRIIFRALLNARTMAAASG